MPTEMELTLEQTQQGVSYEVSVFTMKMEILLEPTSNKLMVEHAEYDESNTYVLERFNTTAGNPVKKILLKLNLSDHRILKDGGGVKEFLRSFCHSDTERLSRSDEVLKLKNFKKDATLKLSKSTNQERTMTTTATQQVTLDNALLPLEKRVKIGKCNMRIDPAKTQKEPTYQVVLDALALTTCYPAFFIVADVPEIYMQQFWFTINKKDSTTYKFKIDKKIYRIDMEVFREIFQNCLRLLNKDFHENCQMMKLFPSLRNLATKETSNLSLKWSLIRSQILWGMFYKKNVDFVKLLSEDFTFQIENRDHKKQEKMYYPRFTKAIIHHFISKDKSISMRNRMFMHTSRDDCLLGPMRFKPASPLKKKSLVTIEEEEPKPAKKVVSSKKPAAKRQSDGVRIRDALGVYVSKKKAPAKAERSKGIELLSDAALLKESQLKKALKRSKQDITIHQACGLSEGADSESEVPDELKGKSFNTSKGTGLKPRVSDVSTTDLSDSKNESWGDSGDETNEQGDDEDDQQSDDERTEFDDEQIEANNPKTSDDKEQTQDDEYIHTPEDYVPTDDVTNEESKEFDEEEYEELYGDVNISFKDVEPADKEKDDEEMTVTGHVNVNQEGAGNQVKDDAQATQKTEIPIPSSSISSDYAAKYLNFDNIPPVDVKVVSMLDINVQHEAPRTSPLLNIPVSVILEHTIANPPQIVTTASLITISSLMSSLFPHLKQLTPIPTPTTTEATTLTTVVPGSKTLFVLHQRETDLEKDVKELNIVDHSVALLSTIKYEVLNAVKEYLGTSLDDALHKVLQKHSADITKEHYVPAEIVKRLRQQYVPKKTQKTSQKARWGMQESSKCLK
ncbi:hypothetical protein Tco_0328203 [Tanacetum coccineum]